MEFLSKKDECCVYYMQYIYFNDNCVNDRLISDERDNVFK